MARSWHYPRWRRVVMQVVLWVVFGLTLGLAALVGWHKRLAGSVDLQNARYVDLPDGIRVGVRLPRGWAVEHDAAEHDDLGGPRGDVRNLFVAHELSGEVDVGRQLVVRCQRLVRAVPAETYLEESGLLRGRIEAAMDGEDGQSMVSGGSLPVAGVDGVWRAVGRPVRTAPGLPQQYVPEYVAVGVLPTGLAVSIVLECPDGGPDAEGDRELIRRVAAGVTVEPGRPWAAPPRGPGTLADQTPLQIQ